MMEGFNGNICTYKDSERIAKLRTQQKFTYDWKTRHWKRDGSDMIIGFNWDNWLADDNVFAYNKKDLKIFQRGVRWNIHYCSEQVYPPEDKDADQSETGKHSREAKRQQAEDNEKKNKEEGLIDDEKNKELEKQRAKTREKVDKGIPITDPEEAMNGAVPLDGRIGKDGKPLTVDSLKWKNAKEGDNNEAVKEGGINDVKKA